jgi:hypothetical protein
VFLYRATDVPGVDKAKLQQQILATVFANGARAGRAEEGVAPTATCSPA